eukprot:6301303-Alexandrium_andersonii.AAC.1
MYIVGQQVLQVAVHLFSDSASEDSDLAPALDSAFGFMKQIATELAADTIKMEDLKTIKRDRLKALSSRCFKRPASATTEQHPRKRSDKTNQVGDSKPGNSKIGDSNIGDRQAENSETRDPKKAKKNLKMTTPQKASGSKGPATTPQTSDKDSFGDSELGNTNTGEKLLGNSKVGDSKVAPKKQKNRESTKKPEKDFEQKDPTTTSLSSSSSAWIGSATPSPQPSGSMGWAVKGEVPESMEEQMAKLFP